ncbi:MAG: TniQ family protein [Burkholderiales bacterium]|nr:TniQ family protein [Burkholderiales bacterium]
MAVLPYLPAPYPDEIFGSWLKRISLHNSRGAWQVLVEESGIAAIQATFFDMVSYDPRLDRLLVALGTNYESTMLELSTMPYWLAFNSLELSAGSLPGTRSIPRLLGNKGRILRGALHAVGIARGERKARQLRYCCECLAENHSELGEPYWHRSHQLPNVFYCPKHGKRLYVSCPACNEDIVQVTSSLVALPRLICSCGFDFRKDRQKIPTAPPYLKLAQISSHALSNGLPSWSHQDVRSYFAELISSSDQKINKYIDALVSAFGQSRELATQKKLEFNVPNEPDMTMSLNRHYSAAFSQEFCGLLVAYDLPFEKARAGFIKCKGEEGKKIKPIDRLDLSSAVKSTELARKALLEKLARNPKEPVASHKGLYWHLRFNDTEWFLSQFPNFRGRSIQSVAEDRREIKRYLQEKGEKGLNRTPFMMRALARDKDWWLNYFENYKQKKNKRVQEARNKLIKETAGKMISALNDLLKNEDRPEWITPRRLGKFLNLSSPQAQHLVRNSPELRAALESANKDKLRRQLRWAARQLRLEGRYLSPYTVCIFAKLPTEREISVIAREVIEQIQDED